MVRLCRQCFPYFTSLIIVPSQSSGVLCFRLPFMAIIECSVAACITHEKSQETTNFLAIKCYQKHKKGKTFTLTIYTSIPSFAIIAASDILVTIPPVVSWAATVISTENVSQKLSKSGKNHSRSLSSGNKLSYECSNSRRIYQILFLFSSELVNFPRAS